MKLKIRVLKIKRLFIEKILLFLKAVSREIEKNQAVRTEISIRLDTVFLNELHIYL